MSTCSQGILPTLHGSARSSVPIYIRIGLLSRETGYVQRLATCANHVTCRSHVNRADWIERGIPWIRTKPSPLPSSPAISAATGCVPNASPSPSRVTVGSPGISSGRTSMRSSGAIKKAVSASRRTPGTRISTRRSIQNSRTACRSTALKIGRPKDRIRIAQFLNENAVDLAALHAVLERHDLLEAWSKFCAQTGIPDPFGLKSKS
jgi:hypothetical protein